MKVQEYSLRPNRKINAADDEGLPIHIKSLRMAFLTIKRITALDRQIIFETRCGDLVTALISKLHYQNIRTIDALLSEVILPQDCPEVPKLGFIYFAACSTTANGNYCNRELTTENNGYPLVSKGGRVSHSTNSYDQPFMNDLHERLLRDDISVSTGILFVLFG